MTHHDSKRFVRPPWIEYPDSEPWWGGWRQGDGEAWLHEIWLPFWKPLTSEEQSAYLEQNPPPNEEWRLYLTRIFGNRTKR